MHRDKEKKKNKRGYEAIMHQKAFFRLDIKK